MANDADENQARRTAASENLPSHNAEGNLGIASENALNPALENREQGSHLLFGKIRGGGIAAAIKAYIMEAAIFVSNKKVP